MTNKIHPDVSMTGISESESYLTQKIIDLADIFYVILDRKQNVTTINKKGCEILGYKKRLSKVVILNENEESFNCKLLVIRNVRFFDFAQNDKKNFLDSLFKFIFLNH